MAARVNCIKIAYMDTNRVNKRKRDEMVKKLN
jgi:hypothetical protein